MASELEEELYTKNEEIKELQEELDQWKSKYKTLEMQKRGSDISLNKIKTEINSLRSVDKLWKDSAKTVYQNLYDVKNQFDAQIEQIVGGLGGLTKAGERITDKIPYNRKVKSVIAGLQARIAQQEETIMSLNSKIRYLTTELEDKTAKVDRLSQGIEEEVERLMKPIRDKLADSMVMIMKEKAARAQERREIADLWPTSTIMPSILLRYRSLTSEERDRRVKLAKEQDANMALAHEIRANVVESKMWELKYDDYGRAFYEHMKTGETNWDAPEILTYKPPPGRDEMGNIVGGEETSMVHWKLETDHKGEVFYKHKRTGEITYVSPSAYKEIPRGKTREVQVSEAAQIVLGFIKEKITKHIEETKKLREKLENPLTPEDVKRLAKEEKNKTMEEKAEEREAAARKAEEDAREPMNLGLYQYDIETVEMLAEITDSSAGKADTEKDPAELRQEKREFLVENESRKIDPDYYLGRTLAEVDFEVITLPQLRGIVEDLASMEEKLENRTTRVRENMKDFSFILMERIKQDEEEKAEELRKELERKERERRAEQRQFMLDRQQEIKDRQEQQKKDLEEEKQNAEEKKKQNENAEEGEEKPGGDGQDQMGEDGAADAKGEGEDQQDGGATAAGDAKAEAKDTPEGAQGEKEDQQPADKSADGLAESKDGDAGAAVPPGTTTTSVEQKKEEDNEGVEDEDSEEKGGKKKKKKRKGRGTKRVIEDGDEVVVGMNEDDGFSDDDDDTFGEEGDTTTGGGFTASMEIDDVASEDLELYFKTNALEKTNYGAILFSSPVLDPDEQDCPEDLIQLSTNLVNFAVFCGFTNLRSAHSPRDSTLEYSLRLDDCRGDHLNMPDSRDDEWLSSAFFISCTHERLDKVRLATSQAYEATYGLMPVGPVDPETLVHVTERDEKISRKQTKSYTYGTSAVADMNEQSYSLWKMRQLMADVIRHQIQQEAIQEAYSNRFDAFKGHSLFNPDDAATAGNIDGDATVTSHLQPIKPHRRFNDAIPTIKIRLKKAYFQTNPPFGSVLPNLYYIQLNLGPAIVRTSGQNPSPTGLRWDRQKLYSQCPVNDIQIDECIVELLDENPAEPKQAFVGRGHIAIDKILGCNIGRDIEFEVEIMNREKVIMGSCTFTLCAEVNEFVSNFSADPKNLALLEVNRKISKVKRIEMGLDQDLNQPSYESNEAIQGSINPDAYTSLGTLVGDLRGDGVDFIKMFTGDVSLENLRNVGVELSDKIAQNLPNFKHATAFLERKTNRHRWEVESVAGEMEELYTQVEELLTKKNDSANKVIVDLRMKLKKCRDTSEELKKEVLKAQKLVADTRISPPQPKQPVFNELPDVPHVPKLPVSGGLDSRGKKKKALKSEELKAMLESVEAGTLDGAESWPMPENNFPSQAQLLKLGKAMQLRNSVLDVKRKQELEFRDRLNEAYATEMERYEVNEKRRLVELERFKKDCRKVNIKYDTYMEIVSRTQHDTDQVEKDISMVIDLLTINRQSKDRFKMARFKQQLEYDRQQTYLNNLKKRLLKAIRARRHALSLPETAVDDLDYARLCRHGDTALNALRYEIFECKQILQHEGIRLRTLYEEEYRLCVNELARLKLSREIVIQRDCYDRILSKYKYEVVHLYSDLEKQRLLESEADMEGVETVDDMGERYKPDKTWRSSGVNKVQRLIDICMAKINLTDGLGNSTGLSQKLILDVMSVKWGADFLPMRDSWTDCAEFERAERLVADAVQWTQNERLKLDRLRDRTERDRKDLQIQLDALKAQQSVAVTTHETETKTITQCSTDVIDVMRTHLHEFREESKAKIIELDQSIINLSRECQKVREELLAQEMIFDEKTKVLWAFIHTLQTAVQQLSAKMEIVLEEKERIVIASKLMADKTRHHLRIERRHCSNLLFIIQSQRGTVKFLTDVIAKLTRESKQYMHQQLAEKSNLRAQIWEQVFTFTRLSTDVDALFEFFAARLANLAGARANLNNALAHNGGALVLAALCKSPRPQIRKFAARALGGMGWDGFVETRILLWDSVMYWKMFKAQVIAREAEEFKAGLQRFDQTGQLEAIISMKGEVEEFVPAGNMSLRTIIKQRRQWALRAARRREGPNVANQQQLNVRDGVIPSLLEMALRDGAVDWEISRNAALAISIASYEPTNHVEMTQNQLCVNMIINMCRKGDAEVQTHAAVTIANLCHKDERSQAVFGESGAIVALVDLCKTTVVDVLEAATAALSNLTCYSDHNCNRVLENNGVEVMVNVITHAYSENLLDLDQNDEVQANASEMLANVSRFSIDSTVPYFSGKVIDALVMMCASPNKQLRRHVPLVMGNISQVESCRAEIGSKGGIEALFLIVEDMDTTIQANTLWALSNLMWHPPNQERAGRFMTDLLEYLSSPWAPVRVQTITLIANTLYYNNDNRVRFLECEGAMEAILSLAETRPDIPLVEGALRALLSLSYVDAIAMWLGKTGGYIPMFIDYLLSPYYSRDSMRYALEILCNLCLHHDNRRLIYENGGVDAIVGLHIDTDPHVRDLSVTIIDYLQDITPPEVLARTKTEIGLERMVTMATSADPLVRAVAAESIGEEIWKDPKKQARAQEVGGIDVLLGIAAHAEEPIESLLPALWSLRNLLHDQPGGKIQFGYRDGISVMNSVLRQGFDGTYGRHSEKIFEAALAVLHTASLEDERNSRRLLNVALPSVLDLAEGKLSHAPNTLAANAALSAASVALEQGGGGGTETMAEDTIGFENSTATGGDLGAGASTAGGIGEGGLTSPSYRPSSRTNKNREGGPTKQQQNATAAYKHVQRALHAEGVNALAKSLLLQLAPFNYVVCRNCHKRQDLHGTSCLHCGHRLLVDPDITEIELRKAFEKPPPPSTATKAQSLVMQAQARYNEAPSSVKAAGAGGAGTFGAFNTIKAQSAQSAAGFTPSSKLNQQGFGSAALESTKTTQGLVAPSAKSNQGVSSVGMNSSPSKKTAISAGTGGGVRGTTTTTTTGVSSSSSSMRSSRSAGLRHRDPLPALNSQNLSSSTSNKRLHSPRPLSSEDANTNTNTNTNTTGPAAAAAAAAAAAVTGTGTSGTATSSMSNARGSKAAKAAASAGVGKVLLSKSTAALDRALFEVDLDNASKVHEKEASKTAPTSEKTSPSYHYEEKGKDP